MSRSNPVALFLPAFLLPAVAIAGSLMVATPADPVVERGKAQAPAVTAGLPAAESTAPEHNGREAQRQVPAPDQAESPAMPVRAHAAAKAQGQDHRPKGVESEEVPGIGGEAR